MTSYYTIKVKRKFRIGGTFFLGGSVRELESVRKNVLQLFGNYEWVKWVHEGLLPAYTNDEKKRNIALAKLSNHCAICRNVNGCCFPKNKNIKYPLHPNCHCFLLDTIKPQITAECSTDKFEGYIFAEKHKDNGKMELFIRWGFGIIDTEYLIEELTSQAKEKYSNGNFALGTLDGFGQRISVLTELDRKDGKGRVRFLTGWLVYPDGNIKNTTPYGGNVE